MTESQKTGRRRLVFMLWLLVAIFYSYLAADYIGATMKDNEFGEYLEFAVNLVGTQGRSAAELRQLVDAKARELELPLEDMSVEVLDEDETLELTVAYPVVIAIPLIFDSGYTKEFEHAFVFNNRYGLPRV